MSDDTRQHIVNLAIKLQGTPYIWGGSTPNIGFDCSGFVVWVLQVFDCLPSGDWWCDVLKDQFGETNTPRPGDLVFYGKENATHVMMYAGGGLVVGASGGGRTTTTVEEALRIGARVKVKAVTYRNDLFCYRDIGAPLWQH